jgi:CHAT domain-containing protein
MATHGVADPDRPIDGGFLMLRGPSFEAGLWTAREIQQERLAAHLAVLSACQTGLGRSHAGGMIGLSRAFQLAGVDRVVMSLWSIDDDATAYVMRRFAEHLETEMPAEALRLAMADGRRELKDPALWAPFLLFGTPR